MSAIIDYRGKTPRKTDHGIPLITAKIVKGGRIETPNEFIDPLEYDDWMRRGMPKVGDVLITTEAPLGEVAQLTEERVALAQRLILLRGNPETLDNAYLKYLLMSDGIQAQLHGRSSGTTVMGIKQSELRKITLDLPSIGEQRSIVSVVGGIDEKIEQNRKTANALELLARTIFRAWFVDFEPVNAKSASSTSFPSMPQIVFDALPVCFDESSIGLVPRGWGVCGLGDYLTERKERVEPSEETALLPYVPIDCITSKRVTLEAWKDGREANSGLIKFFSGDVLFGAMRPYFHKVCLAPFEGVTRTTCFVLKPNNSFFSGFCLMLASEEKTIEYATSHSIGSTIPYAKWPNSLVDMPCIRPSEDIVAAFSSLIEPMLSHCQHLIVESERLSSLRDYLLPKFLSGELVVETLRKEA